MGNLVARAHTGNRAHDRVNVGDKQMVRVQSATFLYLLLHVSPALPMEVDYRVEPTRLSYLEVRGASAANKVAQQIQPNSSERLGREEAARELATRYLDLWSD